VARAGNVVAVALAVLALAIIALLMGVFAAMPSDAPTTKSCGHLLDATYRHGRPPAGCAQPLHQRRVVVAAAASVAGLAALTGVAASARALRSGS
jgi:hypothetical protein